jgi:GTP-binding protein
MEWLGINQIAFAIIFTKIDKLKPKELENNLKIYKEKMFDTWEQLPPWFYTSTMTDAGRPEILQFIKNVMETALKDKS